MLDELTTPSSIQSYSTLDADTMTALSSTPPPTRFSTASEKDFPFSLNDLEVFKPISLQIREAEPQHREVLLFRLAKFTEYLFKCHNVDTTRFFSHGPTPGEVHSRGTDEENGADSDRDEEAPPPAKKRKSRRTAQNKDQGQGGDKRQTTIPSAQEARLSDLTLAMSQEVDTNALTDRRNAFLRAIQGLTISVKVHNQKEDQRFTRTEAVEIANFFFAEVLGAASLGRLRSLIRYYNQETEAGLDIGVAARAAVLAKQQETPPSLRQFFWSFSRAEGARSGSSSSVFSQITQALASLELLNEFNRLRQLASNKDKALLAFLRARGYGTRKGRGWHSCVCSYVAESLHTTVQTLQNTCQAAQGVAGLVEQFGPGIVVILPAGASNRLNRWGNQRMAYVYPLLKQHVDCFQPVCALLELYVYNPIRNGTRIRIHPPSVASTGSLQEKIVAAVGDEDGEAATVEEDGEAATVEEAASDMPVEEMTSSDGEENGERD